MGASVVQISFESDASLANFDLAAVGGLAGRDQGDSCAETVGHGADAVDQADEGAGGRSREGGDVQHIGNGGAHARRIRGGDPHLVIFTSSDRRARDQTSESVDLQAQGQSAGGPFCGCGAGVDDLVADEASHFERAKILHHSDLRLHIVICDGEGKFLRADGAEACVCHRCRCAECDDEGLVVVGFVLDVIGDLHRDGAGGVGCIKG